MSDIHRSPPGQPMATHGRPMPSTLPTHPLQRIQAGEAGELGAVGEPEVQCALPALLLPTLRPTTHPPSSVSPARRGW